MGVGFLYVPLLLNALETDSYAIWLTLTSIVSWIVMFDVGLGNGLRNKLSEAIALNKPELALTYVSTAYFAIFLIGIILLIFFACSIPFTDWTEILNAKNIAREKINELVLVVGASFIVNFMLGLLNSILLALKLPALSSLIGCIGQIMSYLGALVAVKYYHIIDIVILCSIISLVPIIVLLLATIIFFNGKYSYLRPKISRFEKKKFKGLFGLGLKFFWLQIITIILFQANNFIITHTVGASAVVEYNISYKYFYTLVTVFVLICTPFWSASTHAYTAGNFVWIKAVNRKLLKIGAVLSFVGILMAGLARPVYLFWIGEECPPISTATNVLILLYCIFMIIYSANGYIINGIGKLKLQTTITTILAVLYIPTSLLGGIYFGLKGVLIALVFNAAVNAVWSTMQMHVLVNQTATGIWNH